MTVFLNNAATSFPKSPKARQALLDSLDSCPHDLRTSAGQIGELEKLRVSIALALDVPRECVFFVSDATLALNCVINGWIRANPEGEVLFDNRSHNAVSRPALAAGGRQFDAYGKNEDPLRSWISDLPRVPCLICLSWASNVNGSIYDIASYSADIKRLCPAARILIDASQLAGSCLLDLPNDADFLVFPGHKFLYAAPGAAVLIARTALVPWMLGGTNDVGISRTDKFVEVGTPNMPAIASLAAALEETKRLGREAFSNAHQMRELLRCKLEPTGDLELIPTSKGGGTTSVISFHCKTMSATELGSILGQEGFVLRAGLHCNPTHHEALGLVACGTLRFSPGRYTCSEDIVEVADAITDILATYRAIS